MIDVVAERGYISSTLQIMQLLQMILQARWIDEPAILTLPYVEKENLFLFSEFPKCLPWFCVTMSNNYRRLTEVLLKEFIDDQVSKVSKFIKTINVCLYKIYKRNV